LQPTERTTEGRPVSDGQAHGGTAGATAGPGPARGDEPDLSRRLALRPAELARALGCSERHIRAHLHRIPHVRIGGALRFPVDAVRAWLAAQAKVERREADRVLDSLRQRIAAEVNKS
jgi:excisionase family DNA binding protein